MFTFSPASPRGPASPDGPDFPFGPSGPSSPLNPTTPGSPYKNKNKQSINQSLNPLPGLYTPAVTKSCDQQLAVSYTEGLWDCGVVRFCNVNTGVSLA